ncbi:MAG: hypothetical protein F2563_01240 [Actinobacteria bacterium]|uniref:Unannotated protein n=1 Tax=freshwater metagenome TaxID=449393 RepID=A0A6J6E561_9ZZZZ|nr:hypothetical protein [Actinomycetota bacterium]
MIQSLRPPSQNAPRWVHPLAWWTWGLTAATAAMVIANFWFHAGLLATVFAVLTVKRSNGSWANSIGLFFRLAIFIILFRLTIEIIFGVHFGGPVLLTLPEFSLPNWLGGIELGGVIGANGLLTAFVNGFKLATIVVAAAAPAALVPPNLLLKSLPSALYEAGLVTVIALGFLPALSADAKRIKTAAALRGNPAQGPISNLKLLLPLIDSSLARAVTLANAMESKGFGTTKTKSSNSVLIAVGLSGGMLLLIISLLSLLRNPTQLSNSLVLIVALGFIAVAVILSGKAKLRTSYRKLEIGFPEYAIFFTSMIIAIGAVLYSSNNLAQLVIVILVALPIWLTPAVPVGFKND